MCWPPACGCFLVFGLPSAQAGGPGIGVAIGGVGANIGAHAATGNVISAHVSAPAVSRGLSAGPRPGLISGTSPGRLISTGAQYAGPPHYLPGGFTPTIASTNPNINRTGRPLSAFTTPASSQGIINGVNSASATAATGARNAWTDPSSNNSAGRHHNDHFAGTVLYPDGYQSGPDSRNDVNDFYTGGGNYRLPRFPFRRRGYYDGYGGYYAPYAFYGDYSPYVYNDIAGVGTVANDETGTTANAAAGDSNSLSADAVNNLSRPYAAGSASVAPEPAGPEAENAAPPPVANSDLRSNVGPDSLVEAVQAELARRGYFGGKIDAIYNVTTHAALPAFPGGPSTFRHRTNQRGHVTRAPTGLRVPTTLNRVVFKPSFHLAKRRSSE